MKIKSLAAEARIIRQHEKKSDDPDEKRSLYLHRIQVVRVEARSALLLNAFAKWKHEHLMARRNEKWRYEQIEPNSDKDCWFREKAIGKAKEAGKRFGIDTSEFDDWITGK